VRWVEFVAVTCSVWVVTIGLLVVSGSLLALIGMPWYAYTTGCVCGYCTPGVWRAWRRWRTRYRRALEALR
jgi:hypothetical protein